jgi:hypothetical protein
MELTDNNQLEIQMFIVNATEHALRFYLEPWGEEHLWKPKAKFLIIGRGPKKGSGFMIEYQENAVIVTAWKGSTVQIFEQEREIGRIEHRPPVPDFL